MNFFDEVRRRAATQANMIGQTIAHLYAKS
jgi:hypothetical protein